MTTPNIWLEQMRRAPVLEIACKLRMDTKEPSVEALALMTCPACSHRLTAVVERGGRVWRCYACRVAGDALELVARRLVGASYRRLVRSDMTLVGEFCRVLLRREPVVMRRRSRAQQRSRMNAA